MSRIRDVFQKTGHKALIVYVTLGYPDIQSTLRAVPLLARAGCDMVELGIPFSDPMADGATIQEASHRALLNGVTPSICLEVARELNQKVDIPLLFMTYLNPVVHFGFEPFCRACAGAGIGGLIIPDLPPEESHQLAEAAEKNDIDVIHMLSPNSTARRISLVAGRSRGFIYLVSMTGVTGVRQGLPRGLEQYITRVRALTWLPLCVGFGISTPEQAGKVARLADGVIIGSRLIQLMESDPSLKLLEEFVQKVRQKLDTVV
jgi:tryptophan synthase alpha chain